MKEIKKTETLFFAMGTVCGITVYDEKDAEAVERSKERVLDLQGRLNVFDSKSEVSRINANAGLRPVSVSDDTRRLIERSLAFSEMTGGLFDITVAPLSLLWKSAIKTKTVPADEDIKSVLPLVNRKDVIINGDGVMLKNKGQMIDLGAIAKGYAADETKRILKERGVKKAIINFGGTVTVIGEKQNVGIQDPFKKTGTPFASVCAGDRSIVSSGLYEQSFTKDGKTYHHIVDPGTGYPSRQDLAGVTVIGESAETLDALSTSLFMMDPGHSMQLLKKLSADAVFIKSNGEVFITDGIKKDFIFFC